MPNHTFIPTDERPLAAWEIYLHLGGADGTPVAQGVGEDAYRATATAVIRALQAVHVTCRLEVAIEDRDSVWLDVEAK